MLDPAFLAGRFFTEFGAGIEYFCEQGLIGERVVAEEAFLGGEFKYFVHIEAAHPLDVDGTAQLICFVVAMGILLANLNYFGEVEFLRNCNRALVRKHCRYR